MYHSRQSINSSVTENSFFSCPTSIFSKVNGEKSQSKLSCTHVLCTEFCEKAEIKIWYNNKMSQVRQKYNTLARSCLQFPSAQAETISLSKSSVLPKPFLGFPYDPAAALGVRWGSGCRGRRECFTLADRYPSEHVHVCHYMMA